RARSGLVDLQLWVERVAQTIAEEVEADERDREDDRGEKQLVGERPHVAHAFGDEDAPARERWTHAQPEEREPGLRRDRAGNAERRRNDHRSERVRKKVTDDDPPVSAADHPRRLDELLFPQGQHLSAHQARDREPGDQSERDENAEQPAGDPVESSYEGEDQEGDVDEAHHRGAIARQPMPGVAPKIGRPAHGDLCCEPGGCERRKAPLDRGHRYRIRGSRNPYERSTMRFTSEISSAKTRTIPSSSG